MALRRQKIPTARRIQSQRRLWIRLSHNEQSNGQEIRGEKILLEQENTTNNENTEETKALAS